MSREEMLQLLRRVKNKRTEIVKMGEKRDELKHSLMSKRISYDGVSVQTSPSNRMLETMVRIGEIEEAIAAAEDDKEMRDVAFAIDEVDNGNYRVVMLGYYLFGASLYKMAKDFNQDYDKVKQWRRRGVEQMYERYFKER